MLVVLLIFLMIPILFCLIKQKITGQTRNDGIEDVERMVPLKYLSSF